MNRFSDDERDSTAGALSCGTPYERLSAYADGELDPTSARELERHIAACTECTRELADLRATRRVLANPDLRYSPSPDEARRLRASFGPRQASPRARHATLWASRLAAVLVLSIGGFSIGQWWALRSRAATPIAAAVENHERSLLAGHLVDVVSSERHTVKPWFNGRLDFAPAVPDLAAEGFPLRGGRLEIVAGRRAAALVYQAGSHFVNLFVWPDDGTTADAAAGDGTLRGYRVESWSAAGMRFVAVSDASADGLRAFTHACRGALSRPD